MLKLVYGCLAFSFVALVFLIVGSSGEQRDYGMSNEMILAVQNGAAVLDADRYGAITQTGNGVVSGWTRSGKQLWSQRFDRFAAAKQNPFGAGGAIDASAACLGSCPTAVVGLGDSYAGHGSSGAETLAASLNTLPQVVDSAVLATTPPASAVVSSTPAVNATPQLVAVDGSVHRTLPVANPRTAQVDARGKRMIVGSAQQGKSATLSSFQRVGGVWRSAGTPYVAPALSNACLARGGALAATVSSFVHLFPFAQPPGTEIGPPVSSGTCTIAGGGIAVVYTTPSSAGSIAVARYSARGLRIWARTLGARKLLNHAGSPFIVVQSSDGHLTAIDAVSGKILLQRVVSADPFVGPDGSVLTADRKGHPSWLLGGR